MDGAACAADRGADLLQDVELLEVLGVERRPLQRTLFDVGDARVRPHAVEIAHLVTHTEAHAGEVPGDRDDHIALEAALSPLERREDALGGEDTRALVTVNAA